MYALGSPPNATIELLAPKAIQTAREPADSPKRVLQGRIHGVCFFPMAERRNSLAELAELGVTVLLFKSLINSYLTPALLC